MKRKIAVALLLSLVALPLQAEFSDIARSLDAQRGVNRVWIPFLGLARVLVRAVEPEGVTDFQLAVFKGAEVLEPRSLQRLMDRDAGRGFVPLVRAWSNRSEEWSFVYARQMPDSDRMELIVLAHDDEETALVRVVVDPEVLARNLSEPRRVSWIARR